MATDLPAVVLLHHFGGSRDTWAEVLTRLHGHCLCVAADVRGFGGNDGRPFTVEAAADDVISRCDALGAGRVVVVGHSMSARIAMAVAARQPDRMAGLVLVAPSPPTPEPMTADGREQLRRARDSRGRAQAQVRHASAGDLSADRVVAVAEDMLASDPVAWAAWVDRLSRDDLTALVAGVTCPVAVLSGDRDVAVPTAVVEREVVGRLPQATLTQVPGAGHLLPIEAPDVVADAIRRMLTAAPDPPALRALIDSDWVTPSTRQVLQERAAWRASGLRFFTPAEARTLAAACDAMVPQPPATGDKYAVDIAGEIDRRHAEGRGNGWRYADLPPDGEMYRRGLAAVNELAGGTFADRPRDERLRLLTAARDGEDGPAWQTRGLVARRVIEEWLAEAVEIYVSHPGGGYADMNYVGFADARGWRRIGLGQLDPVERLAPR